MPTHSGHPLPLFKGGGIDFEDKFSKRGGGLNVFSIKGGQPPKGGGLGFTVNCNSICFNIYPLFDFPFLILIFMN